LAYKSLGILWNLVEYEDIQELALESGAVPRILELIDLNRQDNSITANSIGCLFSISCNPNCRPHMDIMSFIIKLLEENDKDLELNYLGCLTV